MRRQGFSLTALDELVLSEHSGAVGINACLDYIPGAKLLGYVAARLYAQLNADEAWCVFHSGKVRFSDASPSFGASAWSVPAPLAFHYEKLDGPDTGTFHNLSHPHSETLSQPKQLRHGHLNHANRLLTRRQPRQTHAKVALARRHMSRHATSAATSARDRNDLFAYEAIEAGARFAFTIEADADVDEALFTRVCDTLHGAHVRVGRSRNAQFGRCACERLDEAPGFSVAEPRREVRGGEVRLLLCADLALRDPLSGAPTLRPTPAQFGLMSGEWAPALSCLRARVYSPFNGHRRAHDLERQVLTRGSVLVFEGVDPGEVEALQTRAACGFGLYREQGLGRVLVNPSCLDKATWTASPEAPSREARASSAAVPSSPYATLAARRVAHAKQRDTLVSLAQTIAQRLPTRGPGRAQWGTVRQLAASAVSGEALDGQLFEPERGFLVHGVSKQAWSGTAARLREALSEADHTCWPELLTLVASLMARQLANTDTERGGAR